jgi:hypothetical protein
LQFVIFSFVHFHFSFQFHVHVHFLVSVFVQCSISVRSCLTLRYKISEESLTLCCKQFSNINDTENIDPML